MGALRTSELFNDLESYANSSSPALRAAVTAFEEIVGTSTFHDPRDLDKGAYRACHERGRW